MSDAPVPSFARFRPALLTALLVIQGACLGACAARGARTSSPGQALIEAGWIDAETIGPATVEDPERLEALAGAGIEGRILRLDRLLDLYDGARFAADKDARESLWIALGGYANTRGIDASREVVLRLLDQAYAIEDLAIEQAKPLSEDDQRFVADAIMLLSTDMFLPDSAESLITQTLAYRILAEDGHPRIADNARWRLYDHVRGVLEGAVEIGPELRPDILVHALYAEREDLKPWLEDLAPHARPPLPSATKLWSLLEVQRAALAELPRWRAVLASRAKHEADLRETVMVVLPQPRDPDWVLPELPRGTARYDSLAPVVLLGPGSLVLEPTSTDPRDLAIGSPELAAAIEAMLVRDGRGTLLLAADPQTPAPDYAATLAATVQARATTLELAVHESRIPGDSEELAQAGDSVVVALPLHVARPDDLGPGARALRDARIHVQFSGRGPRVRVDGVWLSAAPALPSDVRQLVQELRRAYPRERVVSLAIAGDVQHGQIVDLLAVLSGGLDPAFFAVGWMPDVSIEAAPIGDPAADRRLSDRSALAIARPGIVLRDPEALAEDERARVDLATSSLRECVPELERLPKQGVTLDLSFHAGTLADIEASGRRVDADALARFEDCARERLLGFRLRSVSEDVTLSLLVSE